MEKFIPYEKLSKKEKRKFNSQKRATWGTLNPVTRKPANPKAYNRQKARRWKHDDHPFVPSLFMLFASAHVGRRGSRAFFLGDRQLVIHGLDEIF